MKRARAMPRTTPTLTSLPPHTTPAQEEPNLEYYEELTESVADALSALAVKLCEKTTALERSTAALEAVMDNFAAVQRLYGVGGAGVDGVEAQVDAMRSLTARAKCLVDMATAPVCDWCARNNDVTQASFWCTRVLPCCGKRVCAECHESVAVRACEVSQGAGCMNVQCNGGCPFCGAELARTFTCSEVYYRGGRMPRK
jgi:hypothetical protein